MTGKHIRCGQDPAKNVVGGSEANRAAVLPAPATVGIERADTFEEFYLSMRTLPRQNVIFAMHTNHGLPWWTFSLFSEFGRRSK